MKSKKKPHVQSLRSLFRKLAGPLLVGDSTPPGDELSGLRSSASKGSASGCAKAADSTEYKGLLPEHIFTWSSLKIVLWQPNPPSSAWFTGKSGKRIVRLSQGLVGNPKPQTSLKEAKSPHNLGTCPFYGVLCGSSWMLPGLFFYLLTAAQRYPIGL